MSFDFVYQILQIQLVTMSSRTVVTVLQGVDGLVSDPSLQPAVELTAVYTSAPRIVYLETKQVS